MSQKNFMSYGDAETLFTEVGNKINDTFVGTQAQWNALTTEQKKAYKFADITDDYDDNPVGNLSALTTTDKSSCVGAINELNSLLDTPTLLASCTDKDTPTDVSNIDISEYKLLVLSLGANNANYGHSIIPTSLIPTYAKRINLNYFTNEGVLTASSSCSFASGNFTITNNSYPAYLYGIK